MGETICAAFQETARARPDDVALRTPGDTVTLTWHEYAERVRRVAAGLAVLGVRHGDTVALMLTNRPEFAVVDMAVMHLGATPFSVYNTSSPEQVAYLFGNAGNRVAVCEAATLDTVLGSGVPLDHVVVVDADRPGTVTLAALEAAGADDFDLDAAWRAVRPDDLATLIYTSGTTGPPKGVETTHRHVVEQVRALLGVVDVLPGDSITSFLPSAHIADRVTTQYFGALCGMQVTYVSDARTIAAALAELHPTTWFAVPRVWEKIRVALEARTGPDAEVDDATAAALRTAIGLDRVRWAWSGAAAIAPDTLSFFRRLGIPLCELWGMSEITGAGLVNPPSAPRLGTVGLPLPGLETRLADDGELFVRAPFLTSGYRHDPERTAEAIDADGWLHTGDIATVDSDEYVTIVDRKKEIIINASGKNMSPANIENTLKVTCPMAAAVTVVGDSRPYVVALVALDPDWAATYAEQRGLSPDAAVLAQDDELRALVRAGIDAGNERLSRVEQVKRFEVLPTYWLPGGDELTPTLKLRRKPISAKYSDVIDRLYA
ncbi:MAG: long-chain fatty acid--CoA ligase [Nocardioidaceae bacterium]|nr:long-chain fatty acid--CoA ligase [Nocardioidaceae bacterium]